jgi:hypothetical protein
LQIFKVYEEIENLIVRAKGANSFHKPSAIFINNEIKIFLKSLPYLSKLDHHKKLLQKKNFQVALSP